MADETEEADSSPGSGEETVLFDTEAMTAEVRRSPKPADDILKPAQDDTRGNHKIVADEPGRIAVPVGRPMEEQRSSDEATNTPPDVLPPTLNSAAAGQNPVAPPVVFEEPPAFIGPEKDYGQPEPEPWIIPETSTIEDINLLQRGNADTDDEAQVHTELQDMFDPAEIGGKPQKISTMPTAENGSGVSEVAPVLKTEAGEEIEEALEFAELIAGSVEGLESDEQVAAKQLLSEISEIMADDAGAEKILADDGEDALEIYRPEGLAQKITQLLDHLGMDYEDKKVENLAQVLLKIKHIPVEELRPQKNHVTEEGTRESNVFLSLSRLLQLFKALPAHIRLGQMICRQALTTRTVRAA